MDGVLQTVSQVGISILINLLAASVAVECVCGERDHQASLGDLIGQVPVSSMEGSVGQCWNEGLMDFIFEGLS